LDAAITKFKQMFLATDDTPNISDEPASALEGDESVETVTRVVNKKKKK
jgi:F-type H+-transporting ATPase subunit alpha